MIRIGLYADNGHQIQHLPQDHPQARIAGVCAVPAEKLPAHLRGNAALTTYADLDALLTDPAIDLVSLCSPRRADQAADAIKALNAGKHVLAEKPCALNEGDLDAILLAAAHNNRSFHEMAETAFCQPYPAMRDIVRSGRLGTIVQVIVEKSYPTCLETRPQDEGIDGGLIAQAAIHALRLIEHVAGLPICAVTSVQTTLGNPVAGGGLHMAAALQLQLHGGAIACVAANYLNPAGSGGWGDDTLRILGTRGCVESRGGGHFTRLIIGKQNLGALDTTQPCPDWLDAVFAEIMNGSPMPLSLDAALRPTRWAIRARCNAIAAIAAALPLAQGTQSAPLHNHPNDSRCASL